MHRSRSRRKTCEGKQAEGIISKKKTNGTGFDSLLFQWTCIFCSIYIYIVIYKQAGFVVFFLYYIHRFTAEKLHMEMFREHTEIICSLFDKDFMLFTHNMSIVQFTNRMETTTNSEKCIRCNRKISSQTSHGDTKDVP